MFFVIPMKIPAWIWAAIFVAIQLVDVTGTSGASATGIATVAHLAGLAIGAATIRFAAWRRPPHEMVPRDLPVAGGPLMRFLRRPRPPRATHRLVRGRGREPRARGRLLLISVLHNAGIPAMQRRTEFDHPGMLAGGPRAILVPARYALEAHAILDPLPDEPNAA